MTNKAKLLVRAATAVAVLVPTAVAFAQAQQRAADLDAARLLGGIVATVVYGLVGIALVAIGFKAFSWVLPFDVKKELEEDHNLSVGVLLAALVLGICLVVAATIHS